MQTRGSRAWSTCPIRHVGLSTWGSQGWGLIGQFKPKGQGVGAQLWIIEGAQTGKGLDQGTGATQGCWGSRSGTYLDCDSAVGLLSWA